MRNITVSVSDEVYTRARIWAAQHDSSVSAVVQYMLSTLRTERRARAFAAAREANPGVRRPVAARQPSRPFEPPAPDPFAPQPEALDLETAELGIAGPASVEPATAEPTAAAPDATFYLTPHTPFEKTSSETVEL